MGYENLLADERTKVATDAAELTRGRGGVFLAAKGGERMKQGVRGMMGIEEPVVTEAKAAEAKQLKLNAILSKYSNAKTRAEFTSAFSELMAAGFPEHAAKIQEHLKNMPKPKEYSIIEGYKLAVEQGYDKGFFQYQIDLKQAAKDNNISFGNIPQDYIITTDASGNIKMEVIEGSPTDIANKAAIDTGGVAAARKAVQSGVVLEDIGRLKDAITNDSLINPASSSILSYIMENPIIGSGKNRIDAISLATTIKSSIGFDRLQQMREESPTGGALGQVSELELVTLQATLGSLDLNQSKENLLYNLERLGEIYVQIFTKLTAYPNFEKYFGGTINTSDTPIEDTDPLEIR